MFGLLDDDDEPPPVIGMSGVLAVMASTATAIWSAIVIWDLSNSSAQWALFGAVAVTFALVPPLIGTALLYAAALWFHQTRWALIGGAILIAGIVIPSVVAPLVTQ